MTAVHAPSGVGRLPGHVPLNCALNCGLDCTLTRILNCVVELSNYNRGFKRKPSRAVPDERRRAR
eukprot:8823721-Alexandrium_andersonii.AAC.1